MHHFEADPRAKNEIPREPRSIIRRRRRPAKAHGDTTKLAATINLDGKAIVPRLGTTMTTTANRKQARQNTTNDDQLILTISKIL